MAMAHAPCSLSTHLFMQFFICLPRPSSLPTLPALCTPPVWLPVLWQCWGTHPPPTHPPTPHTLLPAYQTVHVEFQTKTDGTSYAADLYSVLGCATLPATPHPPLAAPHPTPSLQRKPKLFFLPPLMVINTVLGQNLRLKEICQVNDALYPYFWFWETSSLLCCPFNPLPSLLNNKCVGRRGRDPAYCFLFVEHFSHVIPTHATVLLVALEGKSL